MKLDELFVEIRVKKDQYKKAMEEVLKKNKEIKESLNDLSRETNLNSASGFRSAMKSNRQSVKELEKQFKSLENQSATVDKTIQDTKAEIERLSGLDLNNFSAEKQKEVAKSIVDLNAKLQTLKAREQDLLTQREQITANVHDLNSAYQIQSQRLQSLIINGKKVGIFRRMFDKLRETFKKTNAQSKSTGLSFKKLITALVYYRIFIRAAAEGLRKLISNTFRALKGNKQFASSLNQIKSNFLVAFAPIYNYIIPIINNLMNAIAKLTGMFAVLVSKLFGKSVSSSVALAKGIQSATAAAEDLNGQLSGLDELNVIGNDNKDTQVVGVDIDSDQLSIVYKMMNKINEIINNPYFVKFKETLRSLFITIGDLIGFIYKSYLVPFGEWISKISGPVLSFITSVLNGIKKIFIWLAGDGKPILDLIVFTIGILMAKWFLVHNAVTLVVAGIIIALGWLADNWEKVTEFFKTAWDNLILGLKNLWNGFINFFIDGINGVIKAYNSIPFLGDVELLDRRPIYSNKKTYVQSVGSNGGGIKASIPKLAEGGLAYGKTLSVIGDNHNASVNPEVVAPLSELRKYTNNDNGQQVSLLASAVELLRIISEKDPSVRIDDIGKASIKYINGETRRLGKSPI